MFLQYDQISHLFFFLRGSITTKHYIYNAVSHLPFRITPLFNYK